MEFLPEEELGRRMEAACRARARELVGLGIPAPNAKAQAQKEFAIYDRVEVDERGWVRMAGLDLSEEAGQESVEPRAPSRRRSVSRPAINRKTSRSKNNST